MLWRDRFNDILKITHTIFDFRKIVVCVLLICCIPLIIIISSSSSMNMLKCRICISVFTFTGIQYIFLPIEKKTDGKIKKRFRRKKSHETPTQTDQMNNWHNNLFNYWHTILFANKTISTYLSEWIFAITETYIYVCTITTYIIFVFFAGLKDESKYSIGQKIVEFGTSFRLNINLLF